MSVGSSVSRFLSFLTVLVSCLPLSVRHPHHSSREERGSGRKEATERRDVEWCGWGRVGGRVTEWRSDEGGDERSEERRTGL